MLGRYSVRTQYSVLSTQGIVAWSLVIGIWSFLLVIGLISSGTHFFWVIGIAWSLVIGIWSFLLVIGHWDLVISSGHWSLGFGHFFRSLVIGIWSFLPVIGHWDLVISSGHWSLGFGHWSVSVSFAVHAVPAESMLSICVAWSVRSSPCEPRRSTADLRAGPVP